jgi:hypothetical protein
MCSRSPTDPARLHACCRGGAAAADDLRGRRVAAIAGSTAQADLPAAWRRWLPTLTYPL